MYDWGVGFRKPVMRGHWGVPWLTHMNVSPSFTYECVTCMHPFVRGDTFISEWCFELWEIGLWDSAASRERGLICVPWLTHMNVSPSFTYESVTCMHPFVRGDTFISKWCFELWEIGSWDTAASRERVLICVPWLIDMNVSPLFTYESVTCMLPFVRGDTFISVWCFGLWEIGSWDTAASRERVLICVPWLIHMSQRTYKCSLVFCSHSREMKISGHTYEWVMSHIHTSHGTHMNESWQYIQSGKEIKISWHTCIWVMSHVYPSHDTLMNESWHTLRLGRGIPQPVVRGDSYVCHGIPQPVVKTDQGVVVQIWMSHVTHMTSCIHMAHTYKYEWYEWFMACCSQSWYGVATISRLLKITGLFSTRWNRLYSAKET